MHLFLLYLLACCVNGDDLWDTTEYDSDERAADTAKLINLVNNADSFKVLYITRPDDGDKKEDGDDSNVLESWLQLHKTFDTYRKSNDFIDGANIQYISNPEVLDDYKNLPKERSEILDINGEVTSESSSVEEPDPNNKKSSERLKSLIKHFKRRQEKNLEASNFDVKDAAERIVDDYIRRNIGNEDYLPQDSKETKRFIYKSKHSSIQGDPIVVPVLNTYTVRINLQEGVKPKENNNLNVSNKKLLPKKSSKKKSRNKIEPKSINNSSTDWNTEDKKDILIKRFKIASETKDSLKLSSSKESELNKNLHKEKFKKKKNNRPSNVRYSKVKTDTRQKTPKVINTETKDENNRKFVPNKAENKIPANEQGSKNEKNWESDEKTERNSELRDMEFEKETDHVNKDNIQNEPYNIKTVNTGENYDGDDKPKKETNDWHKKENNMSTKYESKETIFSNRNKKVDVWNKRDDSWERKNDHWDKKEDSRSKERTWDKKDYNNKNKKEDDNMKNEYETEKYSNFDNTRTTKTDDSGWGNYALFKHLQDKKNSTERSKIEEEKIKPEVQIAAPKPSSYESYARKRHDYQKPKRALRSFNRTPIPMVGKRPVYD